MFAQVWLAEWMGTQVAAKELLSFQDKAKDVAVSKHRRTQSEEGQESCSSERSSSSNQEHESRESISDSERYVGD